MLPGHPCSSCAPQSNTLENWLSLDQEVTLSGEISWAQTHWITQNEQRLAPILLAHRDALLIFEPTSRLPVPVEEGITPLRVSVFLEGERIGTVAFNPPSDFPTMLEAELTDELLPPLVDAEQIAHASKVGAVLQELLGELEGRFREEGGERCRRIVGHGFGCLVLIWFVDWVHDGG